MTEFILVGGVLALLGLVMWFWVDSDDDNGGGGLMQPVLIPVPIRRHGR